MNDAIETLRAQLQQLKELHEAGTLGAPAYEAARVTLERRLVDLVTGAAPAAANAPPPVPTALTAAEASAPAASAPVTAPASDATLPPATVPLPVLVARPSWRLVAGLSVAVIAVAVAGYSWTGAPGLIRGVPVATAAAPGADGAPPHAESPTPEQIAAMVDKLAQRLKDKPDDAEGWTMLARAYMVLGRAADALPAYAKAVALRPNDAGLLADYADSLAVQNGRQLDGEALKLIDRALKAEPDNPKALALAGTAAFDRKDYAQAVQYWEKLLQGVTDDSAYRSQVKAGIDEARQLGNLPPSAIAQAATVSTAAPATAQAPAAADGASVSGSVTIAAALAGKASPTDTVFVFARAAEGPRMPLAVLRKQVKDLPFDFRLDDSMAMSPAAKLSGAARVIVGARVSKSGDAIPQDGDLIGQTAPIAPGASGLKIEIADVVKK